MLGCPLCPFHSPGCRIHSRGRAQRHTQPQPLPDQGRTVKDTGSPAWPTTCASVPPSGSQPGCERSYKIQELGQSVIWVACKKSHEGIKTISKSREGQEGQRGWSRWAERRMGFFVMLPSLWLPWTPGRPNGAYNNSFPVMKFESAGFPFEAGPVLASKSHNIYQHTVCIRCYEYLTQSFPSFPSSSTNPPAVPSFTPLLCSSSGLSRSSSSPP